MGKLSAAELRRLKLWVMRVLLCLSGSAFALALAGARLPFVDPSHLPDASHRIEDSLGAFDFLLAIPAVGEWLALHSNIATALAGALLFGLPAAALFPARLHDKFLAGFDHDVLSPIGRRIGVDRKSIPERFPSLAWCGADAGPRSEAWEALFTWARAKAGEQPFRPLARRRFTALSIAILVGPAGSGKSRMAGEFARHLARRDVFGRKPLWRRLPAATGPYLRRIFPFVSIKAADPWDCGILRHRIGEETFDQYLSRLSCWKPRRPTLLILDDPAPMQTRRVEEILSVGSANFGHPVRLLVVGQTVSSDSLFTFEGGRWHYDGTPAEHPPIVLPEGAWFSPREVRHLAFTSGALDDKPESLRQLVRSRLHSLTHGNPLLVELALDHLREAGALDGLSVEALRRERVGRIVAALAAAGVRKPSQLGQLALATLVGGASRRAIELAARSDDLFPALEELPAQAALQSCFPAIPLAVSYRAGLIPPITPSLIGDAFVDLVLAEIGADRAGALLLAAFRINPTALVQQLGRPRPEQSLLSVAFQNLELGTLPGVDPVEWALAHTDLATFVSLNDWQNWSSRLQELREARARKAIDDLGRADRESLLCRLAARAAPLPAEVRQTQYQPQVLLRLINYLGEPPDIHTPPRFWLDLLKSFEGEIPNWKADSLGPPDALKRAARLAAIDFASADALDDAVQDLGKPFNCSEELQPPEESRLGLARRYRFQAGAAAMRSDLPATDEAVRRVDELANVENSPDFWLEAIRARRALLRRASGKVDWHRARRVAEESDCIIARYPSDPRFAYEGATTWQLALQSCPAIRGSAPPDLVRECTDHVVKIAVSFPREAPIQRVLAMALALEAGNSSKLRGGTGALATEESAAAAALAAAEFPDDVKAQVAVALAYNSAAFAWNQVPDGAEAPRSSSAADQVEEVAGAHPNHELIQLLRACSRRYASFAWMQSEREDALEMVQLGAEEVRRVSRLFPATRDIQHQAAMAYGYWAKSLARLEAGAGAGKIPFLINELLEISDSFADDHDIRRELVEAYAALARAFSLVPGGVEAAKAQAAARDAVRVAKLAPDDELSQDIAAFALESEARAWSYVPSAARGAEAASAAVKATAIARVFRANWRINYHAAGAWVWTALAWAHALDGSNTEQAVEAAARVHEFTSAFGRSMHLQRRAAQAALAEAVAWSRIPAGVHAENVAAAAARSAQILAQFPSDPEIQSATAQAYDFLGDAWRARGTPDALRKAREADKRARAIRGAPAQPTVFFTGPAQ